MFPAISADKEQELIESLNHYCLANSIIIYPPNFQNYQPVNAPVTLFPTPISRGAFKQGEEVQTIFNELYARIVLEEEWLVKIIEELAGFDRDFTGKLYETYLKAKEIGIVQPLGLGIFRSDYMVNKTDNQIKQIEFNTVSVSFGGLSTKVGQLHKFLNDAGYYSNESKLFYKDEDLVVSDSIVKLAQGLYDGNFYYNKGTDNKKTIILVIVQENERNVFDQRLLEFELISKYGIKSKRVTMSDIHTKTFKKDNILYLKESNEEISVVYFRSGYSPNDFKSDKDWENRLFLETSYAIKAPNLLTQLSGAKKIQQILTNETILKEFLKDDEKISKLTKTFVKIYPLDGSELGKQAIRYAFEQPDKFVLKPQREGGGNNIYKSDIPNFLNSLPKDEWNGYILMELIYPEIVHNKIIRNDQVFNEPIISELGIFGTILFDSSTKQIITNNLSGSLLRSKFETSNEGGVAAGFGCVDSVVLC